MISSKTLNTAADYYKSPGQIKSKISGFVDDTINFTKDADKNGRIFTADQIASREVQLAIPQSTNAKQWAAIIEAIEAAKARGVTVVYTITR
jgi:filamentous hemagglutinin